MARILKSAGGAIFPPAGIMRRLYTRTLLFSVGAGTLVSMSPIFFSKHAGLSPPEIGGGLTIGLIAGIVIGPVMGRLSDGNNPRSVWALACVLECCIYLAYPFVGSFVTYALVIATLSIVEALGSSARTTYIVAQVPDDERVEAYAFMRSGLNIGFTLGAGVSAVVLLADQPQFLLLGPGIAATTLLLNGVLVLRLPTAAAARPKRTRMGAGAITDWIFVRLAVGVGGLEALSVLLTVTIPLWVLLRTDAASAWVPVLFGVNTVVVVLFQVPVSRRSGSPSIARRATLIAGLCMGVTCAIIGFSATISGSWTLTLLVAGYLTLTLAEMVVAAVSWSIFIAASPANARGEYQAVWRSAQQSMRALCPAIFAFFVFSVQWAGWALVAAFFAFFAFYVARRIKVVPEGR